MAEHTCEVCGNIFFRKARAGTPPKYCSPKCKNLGGARLRMARNATASERRCYRCGSMKPSTDFSATSHGYCKPCNNIYQRERTAGLPADQKTQRRRRSYRADLEKDPQMLRRLTLGKFGLTIDSFAAMLADQEGRCAICRTAEPGGRHGTWHVDHDRSCCPRTGSCGACIRGLLCQHCNLMIGQARDDVERLRAAIGYLERRTQSTPQAGK